MIIFNDYFEISEEYIDQTEFFTETSSSLMVNVDSSVLNTWINYVDILKAYIIPKRCEIKKTLEKLESFNNRGFFHTNLCCIGDDIAILAKGRNGKYWYFYYDQKTTNCELGKFRTTDHETLVIKNFIDMCNEFANSNTTGKQTFNEKHDAINISPAKLTGWITF